MSTSASQVPVNPVFEQELRTLMRAGQPVSAINGCMEMSRARACIQQIAATMKDPWTVITWNPDRGFSWPKIDTNRKMIPIPYIEENQKDDYTDPLHALKRIPEIPLRIPGSARMLFIFQNLHLQLEGSLRLRDALQTLVDDGMFTSNIPNREFKRLVILLHPVATLHSEIRNYVYPITFPPANEEDLAAAIEYVGGSILGGKQPCPPEFRDRMVTTMLGLTHQQAEDTVAYSLAVTRGWDESILPMMEKVKAGQIKQEGFLTYVPREMAPAVGNIGGWDNATRFVRRQCQAYTKAGRGKKLRVPRGILALGLSGTGKSLFAKMVAGIIYDATGHVFPTYKLNYDALFGGIVGDTEANVRRLLAILTAQKHYILVVDEMEKFLGTGGLGSDGGVSRRASAKFLDWLSERTLWGGDQADYGYVIGTMNSLVGLEPEFLRRFDATFYARLPDPATRLEILKIQLRLNHVDPEVVLRTDGKKLARADWDELVSGTHDFVGSEIERAVIAAREIAAEARPDDDAALPTFDELLEGIVLTGKSIMARVHRERIEELDAWCRDRALPVHDPVQVSPAAAPVRRPGRAIDHQAN